MLPRPRLRIPLLGAALIVVGAYVVRSAMRGFDFRPDMPVDAIVACGVVAVFALVAWLRADDARRDVAEQPWHPEEPPQNHEAGANRPT